MGKMAEKEVKRKGIEARLFPESLLRRRAVQQEKEKQAVPGPGGKKPGPAGKRPPRSLKNVERRLEIVTKILIFFAIIGLLVSLYMTWLHFKPAGKSFCSLNEQFDCDAVNKSVYAEIYGVPVSLIGAVGYALFVFFGVLFVTGYDWSRVYRRLRAKHLNMLIITMAVAGFLFSLYLSYVQEFVLRTWCIMCIASFAIIVIILVLAIWSYSYCARCTKEYGKMCRKMCRYCR
jgi:uncharacterized membrane protein